MQTEHARQFCSEWQRFTEDIRPRQRRRVMRFKLLARRIAAPALGLALAATMAACSSSSTSSATAEPSSAASAASSPSAVPSSPASSSSARGRVRQRHGADHRELGGVLQRPDPGREEDLAAGERAEVRVGHQGAGRFRPGQLGRGQGDRGGGELRHQGHGDLRHHAERGDGAGQPDRHRGLPGRHLEGRRRQLLPAAQAGERRQPRRPCAPARPLRWPGRGAARG